MFRAAGPSLMRAAGRVLNKQGQRAAVEKVGRTAALAGNSSPCGMPMCSVGRGQQSAVAAPCRGMATSPLNDFAEALEREAREEDDIDVGEAMDTMKVLNEKILAKGLVVTDEGDETSFFNIKTRGENNRYKVNVRVCCQDIVTEEPEENYPPEEGDEQMEDPDYMMNQEEEKEGFIYRADISNPGGTLRFTGLASDKFSIESVFHIPEDESVTYDEEGKPMRYYGPTFTEMEPDVQEGYYKALKAHGLDDDVATFIFMYAEHKEQCQYNQFVKRSAEWVRSCKF